MIWPIKNTAKSSFRKKFVYITWPCPFKNIARRSQQCLFFWPAWFGRSRILVTQRALFQKFLKTVKAPLSCRVAYLISNTREGVYWGGDDWGAYSQNQLTSEYMIAFQYSIFCGFFIVLKESNAKSDTFSILNTIKTNMQACLAKYLENCW